MKNINFDIDYLEDSLFATILLLFILFYFDTLKVLKFFEKNK